MAALIDVVFLLIVFFMTVSQFSRVQAKDIVLPEAASGEVRDASSGPIVVNVHRDGRIEIAGRTYTDQTVREGLTRHGPKGVSVLIRSDRDTPWQAVSGVMHVCGQIGIRRVRIAVVEGDGQNGL